MKFHSNSSSLTWLLPIFGIWCAGIIGCVAPSHRDGDCKRFSPPLPTVTAVFPEQSADVRVISLSTMIWKTNLLDHFEANRMVFLKNSPAQAAYKLFLLNAAYRLWHHDSLETNVYILTNYVKIGSAETFALPWHFDMRNYDYCREEGCVMFRGSAISFSGDCTCPRSVQIHATATNWPQFYSSPIVWTNVAKWFPSSGTSNQQ